VGDQFYRRKIKFHPKSFSDLDTQISAVISDLLDLDVLPNDGEESIQEEEITDWLINRRKHHPAAVRLALRVTRSGGLVARQRRHGLDRLKRIGELSHILKAQPSINGHATCRLTLTESGTYWRRAGAVKKAAFESQHTRGGPVLSSNSFNQNITFIGNNNRAGDFNTDVSQAIEQIDIKQLATDLAKLCSALPPQPAGAEYAAAISYLAAALKAAEHGDEQETIKQLNRIRALSVNVGRWLLNFGTNVGAQLLVAVCKKLWHLP
jgi:hypothetical protein